jgi:hypothetical protein
MIGSRRAYALLLRFFALGLRSDIPLVVSSSVVLPAIVLALWHWLSAPSPVVQESAVLLPLLGVTFVGLAPRVAHMRRHGQFTYLAGLAVGRFTLLAALLTLYGVVALAGVIVNVFVVLEIFHVHFTLDGLALLFVVPLAYLSLASLSMLLGLVVTDRSAVLAAGNIAALALFACILPPSASVPGIIHTIGDALPTGLASVALTSVDFGHAVALTAALAFLGLYAAAGVLVAAYALPWRVEARERALEQISARISAIAPQQQKSSARS